MTVEELAEKVRYGLNHGRESHELLDGREFDPGIWNEAFDALATLADLLSQATDLAERSTAKAEALVTALEAIPSDDLPFTARVKLISVLGIKPA